MEGGRRMASLRHLVVLVPGMGGSVLSRGDEEIWGGGLGDALGLLGEPERLALSMHDEVSVTGLIPSTSALPGWTVIHGYDRLQRQILNAFPAERGNEARSVLPFSYDFRRSIADAAAELDRRVEQALLAWPEAARPRRVIVVAHSMGGLVARHWLGPGGGWPSCLALITLGTPHRGAPKALDWLVNGVRVGPRAVNVVSRALLGTRRFTRVNDVLRGWPSLYELLPRYPAVLDTATSSVVYPYDLRVNGFDHQRAAAAYALHQDIERAWATIPPPAAGGPHMVSLVGHGHPTPETSILDDGRLRVTHDRAEYLWDDDHRGDGTVPGRAAWPIEFDDAQQAPTFVGDRHGELAAARQVVRYLDFYSGGTKVPIRGLTIEAPTVGLELEELYETGTDVPLRVQVRNSRTTGATAVWCTVRATDSPEPLWQRQLDRDGDGWSSAVSGLAPGFYEVSVEPMGFAPEAPVVRDRFGVADV